MTTPAQSYANHRRFPPMTFIAAFLVLSVNVVWQGIAAVQAPGFGSVLGVLVAVSLVVVLMATRSNPQVVQDRLISLEMRLRLMRVLPAERHGDISRLSLPQLIGLRFASDAELPGLVQETLAQSLSRDAIKRKVTAWQADWQRV